MERQVFPAPAGCDVKRAEHVILSISPVAEDHHALRSILDSAVARVEEADGCEMALVILSASPVSVIITNDRLHDGDWERMLRHAHAQPSPPHVIVASRHADDQLWAKVLNLGAYDLLVKPFDPVEVRRVLSHVCPAQARRAVGVGAVEKSRFAIAAA